LTTNEFRTDIGRNWFYSKYAFSQSETWLAACWRVVNAVAGDAGGTQKDLMPMEEQKRLVYYMSMFMWLPGGRYMYYAGRLLRAYNNCYLLKGEEDTREEWARIAASHTSCLMTGGGTGCDYSVFRPKGSSLSRTGGVASGPLPLMDLINSVGQNVRQGASRRSAMYASLNWQHGDIEDFIVAKDWHNMKIGNSNMTLAEAKMQDFDFKAPLDMTNISVNYDDDWVLDPDRANNPIFLKNVEQALSTGEPGFSFNFFEKILETLRNACTEVSSEDDGDVCNLGSPNFGAIENVQQLADCTDLVAKFLVCGTVRAQLPYEKIRQVREKNRRLGLGIMGLAEWLLKRSMPYEVTPELHNWLSIWRQHSIHGANVQCDRLGLNHPVAYRAIAPTGTISQLAGTTSGIEPLYAVAYKRRYLVEGDKRKFEFVIDATAERLIQENGVDPDTIESAASLAMDPERRIKFQADVQDYTDMAISSTINMPEWGSKYNNPDHIKPFAEILSRYAPRLRGFTCYPDGARGGQPITAVPFEEAQKHKGIVYAEHDVCDITGKGGPCGT